MHFFESDRSDRVWRDYIMFFLLNAIRPFSALYPAQHNLRYRVVLHAYQRLKGLTTVYVL